jgi:ABC transporter substrate binding protein
VTTDGGFLAWPEQFVTQTARARIPAIFHDREFALRGGLSSYDASITAAYRLAGNYAGRILQGDKPGNLPVQQSRGVEFVINLAIAKSCRKKRYWSHPDRLCTWQRSAPLRSRCQLKPQRGQRNRRYVLQQRIRPEAD